MTIVNDNSRVVNKFETSLTDDARALIYDHHMFIVQAAGDSPFLPKGKIFRKTLKLITLRCKLQNIKPYKIGPKHFFLTGK
jgi:hypothetical protein